MTVLTYTTELTSLPGQWRGGIAGKEHTANVSCPKCGWIISLSRHKILDDGSVVPSLVCPYESCTFHDYVKLEGWKT